MFYQNASARTDMVKFFCGVMFLHSTPFCMSVLFPLKCLRVNTMVAGWDVGFWFHLHIQIEILDSSIVSRVAHLAQIFEILSFWKFDPDSITYLFYQYFTQ